MIIKNAYMGVNEPECYIDLNDKYKKALSDWIDERFEKAMIAYRSSTYGLKHDFERETGIFVTNGEFKGAMLEAGFVAVNKDEINWHFKIKDKKHRSNRL